MSLAVESPRAPTDRVPSQLADNFLHRCQVIYPSQ